MHELTAGTESTAKTTSDSSTTARASSSGVAVRTPFSTVKNLSPSYSVDTGINRLHRARSHRALALTE